MRFSPVFMGIFYGGLGMLFTFLAIQSANTSGDMWNFITILLMVLATVDFVYAVRFFILKRKIDKMKGKK
ncbi:YdiK family protein [Pseudalkalibacillus caeni]|uniref:DUF4305 domain-containing protein n=1 Tax=Exobacillus caeni TaxID=2574798 RepID=A0A5R9EYK9_9BACL|nr:YdiK family protein [Pseudalkalibacillus caeni]TLS35286.1 DUF4305 domain-containing protein [Pseudalkalibacillus caeni]